MAHHKEGKIEAYFVEQVELHGGMTRKARWLCRRGCPDRFWAFPRGQQGFAEIKAPGEAPRPHQAREIKKLVAAGVKSYVIDSFAAVDEFIRREA